MFRQITPNLYVSPQISVDQVEEAKALGVTVIINNRPDDEEPGQTNGAEIEAAAKAAGLAYAAVPVAMAALPPGSLTEWPQHWAKQAKARSWPIAAPAPAARSFGHSPALAPVNTPQRSAKRRKRPAMTSPRSARSWTRSPQADLVHHSRSI